MGDRTRLVIGGIQLFAHDRGQAVFYFLSAFLTERLLNIKYSARMMAELSNAPAKRPILPLSILPITPKKAMNKAVLSTAFSILTATALVKNATIAQRTFIRLSPM